MEDEKQEDIIDWQNLRSEDSEPVPISQNFETQLTYLRRLPLNKSQLAAVIRAAASASGCPDPFDGLDVPLQAEVYQTKRGRRRDSEDPQEKKLKIEEIQ